MYGGWDGVQTYDDVYILSLPSFEWIKAFAGEDEREGHSCHVIGSRMLMTVGGHKASYKLPGPCDWLPNSIALFDMVNMTWVGVYNPDEIPYNISTVISERIGGESVIHSTHNESC
jgi:Kelch motif